MRMADEINTRFGIAVSATDLLRCPTLADVARLLPAGMEEEPQALASRAEL
jgi:hypothetical protein